MSEIVRWKDGMACFAVVKLNDNSPIYISVAHNGVIVKRSNLGMFGKTLFKGDPIAVAIKAEGLLALGHDKSELPHGMTNPVLMEFVAAVFASDNIEQLESLMRL